MKKMNPIASLDVGQVTFNLDRKYKSRLTRGKQLENMSNEVSNKVGQKTKITIQLAVNIQLKPGVKRPTPEELDAALQSFKIQMRA